MYDSVIVSFAQNGFNIELLVEPINDVIAIADENDLPIIFTLYDFDDSQYTPMWELHDELDVQGDYFAQSRRGYEKLIADLEIVDPLVCGNLRHADCYVNDGTTVSEASVDNVGETISITELYDG